jgi:hypothetical protein
MRLRWIPSGRRARVAALGMACAVILLSCGVVLLVLESRSAAPEIPEPLIQKSVAVTEATSLGQLPRFFREQKFAENWDGEYLVQWEGIEGLNASNSRDKPIVKYHPAVDITPVQTDGLHQLGVQARGITPKVIFEVGVWIRATPDTKVALNVFDAYKTTQGTSTFNLANGKVLSSVGAIRKAGVKVGTHGWYRPWVQMLSTNGWLVTYVQLLNSDGAPTYKGDGKKVAVFGGIELMPTLEQLF